MSIGEIETRPFLRGFFIAARVPKLSATGHDPVGRNGAARRRLLVKPNILARSDD
jgi:hypothetical protein